MFGSSATCVLDLNQATTFDNRSYPINIGNCWHAMVHPISSAQSGNEYRYEEDEFSVLVRENEPNKKEVMILLGEDEIHVQSFGSQGVNGKVTFNGKQAQFSKSSVAQYKNKKGYVVVQMYALSTGAIRMHAPQHGIEIIYDGARVKLLASNDFRGRLRGLCGTFDGEYVTDFTSPRNCVLKNADLFAASYAVVDDSCQGPAKDLHEKSKNAPCYRETVLLGDVISDEEAGRSKPRAKSSQSNHLRGMNSMQGEGKCLNLRIKVIEQPEKICFSLQPLPKCGSMCKSSKSNEKRIGFHCLPHSSATKHWVEMIMKGSNPNFSQKEANAWFTVSLPERCTSSN